MPTFSVDDPELKRYLANMFEQSARRALVSTGLRVLQRIITVVIPGYPRQPVARGTYRAAWRFKQTADGCEIYNTAPHGPIVEFGARAANIKIGRRMINALVDWLQIKGIESNAVKARGIAFAIANSMKAGMGIFNGEGSSPYGGLRVMDKALETLEEILREEIAAELRKNE